MADEFRRKLDTVGKGGVKCDCCNKYHGKHRRLLNKLIRTRLKQRLKQRLNQEEK